MAIGLQLWGLPFGSEEFRSVVSFGWPNLVGIIFLIGGGFTDNWLRPTLWAGFVLVLFGSQVAAGSGDWIVRTGHFAERHGLIIIIALGEVVVAIGIPVVESLRGQDGLPSETLLGLTAAGIMAGLLWWAYFDRVFPAMEYRAESLDGRDRVEFARDIYTWIHALIVAGVIATAAAAEEILLHPKDSVQVEFRVMFAVGLGMFFGGIVVAVARAFRRVAKERLAAVAAIIFLAVIGGSWDGFVLLLLVDAVLLISIIAEHVRIESPNSTV